jgi:Mn2+/Fe2+ NRAMP family transporter
LFLAVLGPGIITSVVDNDAPGIATYSVAGASFGYKLLWTLIPMTVLLIIVQEMAARMGVVTGKGLGDLIRENHGIKVTFYFMVALVIANLGTTTANFAGWAASLEIFGISKYLSVPVGALLVWWLVIRGSYKRVEKVFLFASAIYITYIVSGLLARPAWGEVLARAVVPSFSLDTAYLYMVIAVIGTTITPWMQFYLQSAVVEKGIKLEEYGASRLDVAVGGAMTNVVTLFIMVACAATLFAAGIRIETAKDAALALGPLAGRYASILFAIGLANASILGAAILPLSTAYSVAEGMGWEGGVNKTFREAPHFMWLYTGLIVLGVAIILIPRVPLIQIMVLPQAVNGMLLPIVLIFMLRLINKEELMGKFTNGKLYNVIAWGSAFFLIGLSVLMLATTFVSGLKG